MDQLIQTIKEMKRPPQELKKDLKEGAHPVLFSWMKEILFRGFAVGQYPVTQAFWERYPNTHMLASKI